MDYAGKTIAVIGMARTGLAVAEVMVDLGARVVLYDQKPESELVQEVATARALGAEVRPGTDNVILNSIQDRVDLLVPSPGVRATLPVFLEARERGVDVLSEIELAYLLSKAPMVAITGTNGKTTTTILTGRMLQAGCRDAYIAGNVDAGDIRLALVTAAHKAAPESIIVAEISTFQLEWIQSFRPRIAMLLNVSSDHVDRHGSVQEYRRLKARVFENQTKDDIAVLNADNPFTASLAPGLTGRVLQFSRQAEVAEGGFVRGDDLIVRFDGAEHYICRRADVPLLGEHNVENVLAAACAAIALGVGSESIATAIREFLPVEHRLEPVAAIDGVQYVNNSMCTNVDATVRSIEAIDEPQVIIAGGKTKDRNGDYGPVGDAIRRKAKHLVLIGADRGLIRAAAEAAGFTAISDAKSMQEAVDIARAKALPGDVVVLTPGFASFDMFDSFAHRGRVFKEIVRGMQK